MSNTNIQTIEGTEYKVTLNVSGVANLTDYRVEGSCKAIGSCAHGIKPFRVAEASGSTVVMFIPTLASGSYLYQVFITRISTNQEFMVMEGRIDVSNKIKANEDTTIAPTGTVADVTMNAETVEVTVAITEGTAGKDGINGKDGEKGEKGEKGDAFTFDDFTPEQLATLKGEKGERGEKGEKGDPGTGGGASIDWIQNTDRGVISIGKNQTLVHNSNPSLITYSSIVIGNNTRCADYGAYPVTTERCVVIGHGTTVEEHYCCTLGHNISTYGQEAVAIGEYAQSNYKGISIGSNSWTSNNAVAIGSSANADSYGIAIGENAQADYGNITLKSGNVEVKFTPDGMTINGNAIGGGSGSGGSGIDRKQEMLYQVKYKAKQSMYYERNNCNPEWVERDGYSGNWYEYYNDLTANGEWFYDFYSTDCDGVFNSCPWITTFAAKIENCNTTNSMFYECNNLEYFATPSALVNCVSAFVGCYRLKDFYADLAQLESGSCMFGTDPWNCTCLNVESVEFIADSIREYYGEFYIGMARELQYDNGDGKYSRCQEALQKIRTKGWTVYEMYSENN